METSDTARTEATRWLILLQEQPDDHTLKTAFEAWLVASPANAEAWAETSHVGALMAQSAPRYRNRWSQPKAPWRRKVATAAAALAIAAAIVIALTPNVLLRFTADYVTGTADVHAVPLPDGSVVHLAPDSAIDVDYAPGRRHIRLIAGGAFFEVQPDAVRPFTVATGVVETTVLGTAFDVRLDDEGVAVAVRHGSVRVESAAGLRAQLGPGDWVRARASGGAERGAGPPDQAGAWLRGELVARDQSVAEVVAELRRYFPGAIFIMDDRLAAQPVTGLYALDDPVQTLRAVALTHGATLHQISPWVLVLSKD
ncbi:FecR family protein [Dongia deserti]|uniref:FecR family protein n=1 Tax=Dongia deserti TaxID=2268030 RepID=UPI0013C46C68|nr:FecR domain-containing protein [Dongia deserti]